MKKTIAVSLMSHTKNPFLLENDLILDITLDRTITNQMEP